MRRLWPFLVVVCACRDREAPKPADHGSAVVSTAPNPVPGPAPGGAGPHHAPAQPELPGASSRPRIPSDAGPPAEQEFAAEPDDRRWKAETEPQLRKRLPRADDIECHQTTCRITFAGKMDMLSTELDEIQSEQSLRGMAKSGLLTAPEQRPDGNFSIRVYARFERDD